MHINSVNDFRKTIRKGPFTWPGAYDIFGITSDGAALCFDCMEKERRSIVWSIGNKVNDGWKVEAIDATCNVEDTVCCDHCNKIIFDAEA